MLKSLNADRRSAGLYLLLVLGEDFVNFGQDDLMGNRVTSEKPEDVGVVLFDAVFAVDEDEGSTESGLDAVGQKTAIPLITNTKDMVLTLTVSALEDTS